MTAPATDAQASARFAFGENWLEFSKLVNAERIEQAMSSLREMLEVENLKGRTFLDIGSGSGLFSLAAHELGAKVHSFDYDEQSVACTRALKERYSPDASEWTIARGSVLDQTYLRSLGQWDVVYSWGVLHHTGALWQALENAAQRVAPGGRLFIAIYNDQGRSSRIWKAVKRAYNGLPRPLRWLVLMPALLRLWGPTVLRDLARGRPLASWRAYSRTSARGMSAWRDVVDWVGGLPFEVATPEAIFDFYRDRGFLLRQLRTCGGGLGCNEFVFMRETNTARESAR